jgi:LacI family transcriptional regulator
MIDFPAAGALAAAHFRGRGLRRFGFVGQERNAAGELLLQGFREAVQADGFDVDVLRVGADPQDGAGWMRIQRPLGRWTRSLRPPVGVLTSSDILARYLCAHGTTAGLRIPDDLAVVGSGNTMLLCELLDPAISSLDHGFERVGRRAAELLEALMAGRTLPPSPVRVPPSGLVPRRSSDVFAVEDAGVAAALRAIWASSHRPTKVAGVLAAVPTSRRTLERRFRELLGRTVHDEIRRAHVEQAKRLLVETADPLKAVATRSGFRDPQQFSRVFRASEGLTPGEYRRIHAG